MYVLPIGGLAGGPFGPTSGAKRPGTLVLKSNFDVFLSCGSYQ